MNDKKLLNEILKDNYYKKLFEFYKTKNKNELIEIIKKTLRNNNNMNEILISKNLKDLNYYDLYNNFIHIDNFNIFILKYIILYEKF